LGQLARLFCRHSGKGRMKLGCSGRFHRGDYGWERPSHITFVEVKKTITMP
jgi:hypothetical protein